MIGCDVVTILDRINGHGDLKNLTSQDQLQLCQEIREFLIANISQTGGHLASNLGVVELTVALETVLDTRCDRLVFDVGHQSYVHKLLTGRQADFSRLRKFGGIAGFPKPGESDADAFVAGHASSSVSIALGMARARTLQKQDYDVVALIGDGAATGGMAYEGLNDAAESGEPMIVILNDNEMSIDRNVGGLASHLSRLRSKARYLGMKNRYRRFLGKLPGGECIYRFTHSVKNWVKRIFLPRTIFENMGFLYLGPVDGHDLPELIALLRMAKEMRRPVLLHVITQKGRGYKFAEEKPWKFHGVGQFDPDSGQMLSGGKTTFSDTFGSTLTELAQRDPKVCAITAAMPGGTGLLPFAQAHPDRIFDVGIAEEHAVSMAGGLAKQGMIPVVALYSTFLQRSFDQMMQDIALLHLHVVLAVDRAGLVGEDGETHHGVFDVGFLRQIPGMTILAPASCPELKDMLTWAVEIYDGPVAIRYPRGGDRSYHDSGFAPDKGVCCHRQGTDFTIITYGTMVDNVMGSAEILCQNGVECQVLRLTRLSPLPVEELLSQIPKNTPVLILEETAAGSGISEAISWHLKENKVHSLDLGGSFVTHGTVAELYQQHGLDAQSIAQYIRKETGHEN